MDVPAACPNNCCFCVSRMHANDYPNNLKDDGKYFDFYLDDYISKLRYVQKCGCQTVIFTGTGEPLLNKRYLHDFALINKYALPTPFEMVELQTSGVTLDHDYLRFLRNTVKVKTISLSVADIFNDEWNAKISQTPPKLRYNVSNLCEEIVNYGFTLRLSLNMTDTYNLKRPEEIFERARLFGARQVTIRVLYLSPEKNTPQDAWIKDHSCDPSVIKQLKEYVKQGNKLGVLPFGAVKYSIYQMSTVIDDDCMSTKTEEVIKYAILRPDCHLYTRWDDKGSRL